MNDMALPFFNKKKCTKRRNRNNCSSGTAAAACRLHHGRKRTVGNQTWYATKVWTSGRSKKFQRPVPVLSGYWSAKCIFLCFFDRKLVTSTRWSKCNHGFVLGLSLWSRSVSGKTRSYDFCRWPKPFAGSIAKAYGRTRTWFQRFRKDESDSCNQLRRTRWNQTCRTGDCQRSTGRKTCTGSNHRTNHFWASVYRGLPDVDLLIRPSRRTAAVQLSHLAMCICRILLYKCFVAGLQSQRIE